jgi:carbamate kinase
MRRTQAQPNVAAAAASFIRDDKRAGVSFRALINDDHPAMIRMTVGTGARVAVEIWSVPRAGLAAILLKEPPGLTVSGCRRPFQLAHGGCSTWCP